MLRLLVAALPLAAAQFWRVESPSRGGVVVTDEIHIAAVYGDAPADGAPALRAPGGAPPAVVVCFALTLGDRSEHCEGGWGAQGSAAASTFSMRANLRSAGHVGWFACALEFWVAAPGDPARAPLFGVLALDFVATDVDGCAALARDAPPALNSRRVFDVFPFFNERDVLEVRLREHDDVVDVFVPVEGSTTHSGGPKDLAWRDGFSQDPDARGLLRGAGARPGRPPELRRRRRRLALLSTGPEAKCDYSS